MGTSAVGTLHGGQLGLTFNGAVDSNVDAVGQGQGTVGRGGGGRGGDSGVGTAGAVSIISGDQQGHTGGNGVVTGGNGAVGGQRNQSLAVGRCIGDGLGQVSKVGAAHIEHSCGGRHDDGLQGVGSVILDSKGSGRGNILTQGHIVPAYEFVAAAGGSGQGVGHGGGVFNGLGVGAGGHSGGGIAVGHGIATGGGGLKGGGDGRNTGLDQADFRHVDVHGVGSTVGFICAHNNGNGSAGGQFLGVFHIGNSSGMLGAIDGDVATGEVTGNGILEGQCGCDTLIIGNGQRVALAKIDTQLVSGDRTVQSVAAGLPIGGAAGQTDTCVGQAADGSSIGTQSHGRNQAQDQSKRQHQGQESLGCVFHVFFILSWKVGGCVVRH